MRSLLEVCGRLARSGTAARYGTSLGTAGSVVRNAYHWRDDRRSEMLVQFVRRDHETRSRLANLTTNSRIEPDEVHITPSDWSAPYRHRHSFSSN